MREVERTLLCRDDANVDNSHDDDDDDDDDNEKDEENSAKEVTDFRKFLLCVSE